jgi:two-component system sensor histidine kinase BaeS
MRRGLRLRLAITHALVAIVAIVIVALVVNIVGGQRFDTYLAQVQRARNEAVVGTLAQTYKAPDGWDANAVYALSRVAMSNNVDAAVYSLDGQLLFTVQGRHYGPGMMNGMMGDTSGMMGGAGASASPTPAASANAGQFTIATFPVVVRGQKVATADIYSNVGMRQAAESAYQSALTRNLIIAAVVAAVVAFLISLFVSRRITAPLEELTDAAADVATGDFGVRVAPRANDEVGALASAFNAMADRLARDEQWRRDMTADLSHELRTPLATIQTRIEALEDGVLPATPENLRVIGAEVERLGRLLGALRNLNELESEDLEVEHEPLDLAEVAGDAVARAETAYAAKGVTLESVVSPAIVKADRDRLLQVAGNLLDNALKFTPQGGRVDLEVGEGQAPTPDEADDMTCRGFSIGGQRWAVLTVSDSGSGIDPVDLPFVFDRFYRSQSARSTQGVGLGLAIARGLVEAQGGEIDAANKPAGGAVFTVRLPLVG